MTPLQIILYWPIIILIKTLVDFWQHKTGRKIKHGIEFWAMVFVAFFYQVAAGIRREEQWELAGFILMYQFFSYVALHDLLINTWMGKSALHWNDCLVGCSCMASMAEFLHVVKDHCLDTFYNKCGLD